MKKYSAPLLFFGIAITLLVLLQMSSPRPIDWTENYYAQDKRPYGAKVLVDMLPSLFPKQKVNIPQTSLYKRRKQLKQGNYIFVNKNFFLRRSDLHLLLDLVYKGSNAFIAASSLSRELEDTLDIESKYVWAASDVKINFTDPKMRSSRSFDYTHINYLYGILREDSATSIPPVQLGTVEISDIDIRNKNAGKSKAATNFVAIPWGKGYFFIHTMPQAFSNYNMIHPENVAYIAKAFSYLPEQEVFWEDFYTEDTYASTYVSRTEDGEAGKESYEAPTEEDRWDDSKMTPIRKNEEQGESQSMFRFLLSEPPLKWAFYLTLLSLVLFVFFEAKRRQRIVPIIKPLANTTLEFTETIGRLYFQHQDHKNIAEKKITYFLEYIRTRYYLSTHQIDDEFYISLARKSGYDKEEIILLFRYIQYIQKQGIITEEQLLDLNRRIQNFIK
ncbi:DUF4350 domain-containing protein [Xanthocytophaga flava]|uniref:DUF4350 domain-containing protein n=1 Tax=Xanthocytophaga flava TaxID=3048013 RepID=UPI0028D3C064|nr:DUF4350 domain-containing protein [Xanthocytophaga flavus]MDJ1468804.1 hypothetical protein [Xanthocytophaga flavus]